MREARRAGGPTPWDDPADRWPADPAALEALLQQAYRYALALTHDPGRAEDLVQDVCLSLGRQGGPWQPGYLLRCLRNRFIDLHRRGGGIDWVPLDSAMPLTESSDGRSDGEWWLADPHDPGLGQALAGLRPDEREALYLSVVEGYTAREIGLLTRRPRGTVLSLLFRAKARLRAALAESVPEGEDLPLREAGR